jgi:uncharacterized protein CbrC (UPF0167 family)
VIVIGDGEEKKMDYRKHYAELAKGNAQEATADTIEAALPAFKYHPNCAELGIFTKAESGRPAVCQCCGKETEYYYNTMYSVENVNCLCPDCVASGAAAEKFSVDDVKEYLEKEGSLVGYLFQCLHCGKYRIWVDAD